MTLSFLSVLARPYLQKNLNSQTDKFLPAGRQATRLAIQRWVRRSFTYSGNLERGGPFRR